MTRVARLTQQAQTLDNALEEIVDLVVAIEKRAGWLGWSQTKDGLDGLAQQLSQKCRDVQSLLSVSFVNLARQEKLKKYLTRIKNLTKILASWSKANSWAELEPLMQAERTRSKSLFQKVREYAEEAVKVVAYFDTEHEGTNHIGPWTVVRFTSANGDWSDALMGKLTYILGETERILKRVGLGSAARGEIFAFPSKSLPGGSSSPGALASFNIPTGRYSLAVGGDPQSVVLHVAHEVGHHVYYKMLSGNARATWEAFFESESGVPDVDTLIKLWEEYASRKDDHWAAKFGRYTAYFAGELKKSNPDMLLWLEVIASKIPNTENLDPLSGKPKKGDKPGLDTLIENRGSIRTFLHPVTAYSAKDASECFAEVFSLYTVEGPGRIPEIVRAVFQRVLPQIRTSYSYDRRLVHASDR